MRLKSIDKAGTEDNILLWNNLFCKMFCWTPLQLSFLKDESLKNVIFLSPPSCGKTELKKAKVKYFAIEKREDVVFLVPCYDEMQTLLFHHIKNELGCLKNQHIKVDTVKAGGYFNLDEDGLKDKWSLITWSGENILQKSKVPSG